MMVGLEKGASLALAISNLLGTLIVSEERCVINLLTSDQGKNVKCMDDGKNQPTVSCQITSQIS